MTKKEARRILRNARRRKVTYRDYKDASEIGSACAALASPGIIQKVRELLDRNGPLPNN